MSKFTSNALRVVRGEISFEYILYRLLCNNKIKRSSASLFRKWDAQRMRFLPTHIQPIAVETYDGLNQTVHPRVILNDVGVYTMSITPYPFGDNRYENPCVYISQNGVNWSAPEGVSNPLALPEPNGWNYLSDSEVIYAHDVYWLYYRESIHRDNINIDRIYRIESEDLQRWTVPALLFETPFGEVISPSIIGYKDYYHIYYVCFINSNSCLKRCVSCNGNFENEEILHVKGMPQGRMLWHIDVVDDGDLLRGLFVLSSGYSGLNCDLFYAESNDGGNHWIIKNKVFILENQEKYFKMIYASSMVKDNAGSWCLFFSAKTRHDSWHTFLIRHFDPEMN
ncbi:MAG: hypothetical protein NT072_12245 [Deltaproteobacteria bacterium]|nr:hypothetical protein [Deltaproteobacteria bacterium]